MCKEEMHDCRKKGGIDEYKEGRKKGHIHRRKEVRDIGNNVLILCSYFCFFPSRSGIY